jgi:ABC-2 type transport system ATP-binding protein
VEDDRVADVVIRAERLTKSYGQTRALVDLDLEVFPGEVFGFLGPNGAGKSTTIRLMLDLIRPTRGRVVLFGLDSRRGSVAIRRRVGYVPGDLRLYDRMTARELFTYFARLRGLSDLGDAPRVVRRLELELDRPIGALSKGNRQKVGLVQAFLHRPDLLVLDEPTAGLDPLVQQGFYELMREATAAGAAVFLSSHVLPEVQHAADRVALIREGRLVLVDTVEALREKAAMRMEVTFAEPPPPDAFAGLPGVREAERRNSTVRFAVEGDPDALVKALGRFHVRGLESREADLEDVFLGLFAGEEPDAE